MHLCPTEVAVYAENMLGGYGQEGLNLPGIQTLFLTPDEPLGHVILKIGPRPGILRLTLRDKQTRKFVSTATLRFVSAGGRMYASGTGNFESPKPTQLCVPIRAATDVMLEVTAPGYRTWHYTDAVPPSQTMLHLESDEQ